MPVAPPLSSAPDLDLVALYQEGRPDALDVLLTRYRRFARSRARRYYLVGGEADDLEQEALIGLCKAARDFRPDHEVAFRPFAQMCITRQILSAIKAANRKKHQPLSASVTIHGDADDGSALEDRLCDPTFADDPAEQVVGDERVRALAVAVDEELSALECAVLPLFVAGRSYVDIAERVGRHPKAVDNAVQRIRRKLGRSLDRYELAAAG